MRYALVTLVVAAIAGPAFAQSSDSSIEAGRRVALRACANCHAIDEGKSPATNAPPFRTFYRRFDIDSLPNQFKDGMMAGHSEMPIVRLDAAEVAALTAYIKGLGPMGSRP